MDSLSVKRLADGCVVVSAGKVQLLAVRGDGGKVEFFEPNGEQYGTGDRVALGIGWRRLEIATQGQVKVGEAARQALQSRDNVAGQG